MLLAFSGCTCTEIAGPDAQLREAAKGFEQLTEVGRLAVRKLQITRITPEPDLAPPRVVFSFDLEGTAFASRLDHHGVQVSALGVERVPMQRTAQGWRPAGSPLPALGQALDALYAQAGPLPSRWLIRVDVGKVEVTEEYPVGHKQYPQGARRSLVLRPAPDGGLSVEP